MKVIGPRTRNCPHYNVSDRWQAHFVHVQTSAGYERLLRSLGEVPSITSKSSSYIKSQADPGTTIYDGRRASGKQMTVAPAIYMYHPIFLDFYKFLAEAPSRIMDDFLSITVDLMDTAAIIYVGEDKRMSEMWKCLNEVLGTSLHSERNSDGTCLDGLDVVIVYDTRIGAFIVEIKREFGEGGSDASTQVSHSTKRNWSQEDVRILFVL